MTYYVNYSKAQIKIEQMAFVLVALMIFLGMVALLYFTISLSDIRGSAENLQDDEAKELGRKMASTSEFSFSSASCSNCIDLDKVLLLKERNAYKDFWNIDYLQVKKLYPKSKEIECTRQNYPDCSTITIIENENFGSPSEAFVSLCHWDSSKGGYEKCEFGSIRTSNIIK